MEIPLEVTVANWCDRHGWAMPTFIDGKWWAYPPTKSMRCLVPMTEVIQDNNSKASRLHWREFAELLSLGLKYPQTPIKK